MQNPLLPANAYRLLASMQWCLGAETIEMQGQDELWAKAAFYYIPSSSSFDLHF